MIIHDENVCTAHTCPTVTLAAEYDRSYTLDGLELKKIEPRIAD